MLRLRASLLAILGAGDHHPVRLLVSEPLPFEVWDGRLAGRAARTFHVRAGGHRAALAGERVTADVGVYVHRATGDAAAWNAGAEFEGASTLKLPIMVAALAVKHWHQAPVFHAETPLLREPPGPGPERGLAPRGSRRYAALLGGSEVAGAADMVAAMQRPGCATPTCTAAT